MVNTPLNANLGKHGYHLNYHLYIIKDQLYLVLVHYLPMADMKSLKFTTVVDAITVALAMGGPPQVLGHTADIAVFHRCPTRRTAAISVFSAQI